MGDERAGVGYKLRERSCDERREDSACGDSIMVENAMHASSVKNQYI